MKEILKIFPDLWNFVFWEPFRSALNANGFPGYYVTLVILKRGEHEKLLFLLSNF